MQVAYLVNQYPKVSHSFIRREIQALEHDGVEVFRIALRGWDAELVDPEDEAERGRTSFVLQHGALPLLAALLHAVATAPLRCWAALRLALKLGRRGDRPLPFHLIYLAEACVIKRWLRARGIGHMHAHFGTNSAEVAMLCRVLGGPRYSFTVHGYEEFDKPVSLYLTEKIAHAEFVAAVSSFGRSQLYRWAQPGDWPKVSMVRCGLDASFLADAPEVQGAPDRLVCVGRLCGEKGHLLLVEAVHRLRSEGLRFTLVFAGDGELRPAVEQRIAELGLGECIRITGWLSCAQVRDELLAARALVLPSLAENLPVVLMEAMALRRPVLTTYVGGIPELVDDGRTGWLFPAGDVQATAAAMRVCLQASDASLRAMGAQARLKVLRQHDVRASAAQLRGLFERSLGSGTKGSGRTVQAEAAGETRGLAPRGVTRGADAPAL